MITRPAWAKDAIPTERGWVRGKELLTCRRHTKEEIDEWFANQNKPKVVEIVEEVAPRKTRKKKVKTDAVLLTEAPIANTSVGNMTRPQIEALEKQYDVVIKKDDNQTLMESSDSE